jgi:uncharacterized protein (DUF697 family)
VFGIRVTEGAAKGILSTLAASFIGRGISQALVGWIPGLGNIINAGTAAAITEAIGWTAVEHFKSLEILDRQKGLFEGKKEGYKEASTEYEHKFRQQAENFESQVRDFENGYAR